MKLLLITLDIFCDINSVNRRYSWLCEVIRYHNQNTFRQNNALIPFLHGATTCIHVTWYTVEKKSGNLCQRLHWTLDENWMSSVPSICVMYPAE